MMEAEFAPIAIGVLGGVVVGGGLSLWRSARECDERCEFLQDMRGEMAEAFAGADRILSDDRTPTSVRVMFLYLLHAYSDDGVGERLARAILDRKEVEPQEPEDDALAVALRRLADVDPSLARTAHQALGALLMGLLIYYYGDQLKATKVQRRLASDPVSVWSRLGAIVGLNDHHHHGNGGSGVAHA